MDRSSSLQTVRDIGEQGLLQIVQRFCPVGVVGDDAALIPRPDQDSLVVTTDVLIDGVHFSDRTTPAHAAGWRAIAANLSDLAAMGARPIGVTVGLGLPPETPVAWVEALYEGMGDCLQAFGGAPIVGGDVVRSSVRTLAITALGQVDQARAISRSKAQPGDAILVTGYHGASQAGLELLLNPEALPTLNPDDRAQLIRTHQYPIPQLQVGQRAATYDRVGGMDSSDGLADAIFQICRASGVGAIVDALPIHPALIQQPQVIDWTLYGGEDFELVLCLPPEQARELLQTAPPGSAIVGQITADRSMFWQDATGQLPPQPLTMTRGFQHFGAGS